MYGNGRKNAAHGSHPYGLEVESEHGVTLSHFARVIDVGGNTL
jgi:hypothetical protein